MDERMTLLPCPFCGGKPVVKLPELSDGFATHVYCRCGVQMYGAKSHFASEHEASATWNRRVHLTQPVPCEMCKKLQGQIDALQTVLGVRERRNSRQPAQAVDVRSAVVKALGGYLERHWPDNPVSYDDMADHITRAIGNAQAEG